MASTYKLQISESTRCGNCDNKVIWLLADEEMRKSKPAFYICFVCKFVGEVGKGHVEKL